MRKTVTVGDLKRALRNVPDNLEVIVLHDNGLEEALRNHVEEAFVIESGKVSFFVIYERCESGLIPQRKGE